MNVKYKEEKACFDYAFGKYKNRKIALYGIGRRTNTLLKQIRDYNIIGVCDRDNGLVGSTIYGKKVLSRNEVENQADILIICTSPSFWNVIYQRIEDWNIPIFFLNGDHARIIDKEELNINYTADYVDLESIIDEHDVISFDIYDTLIMRMVGEPEDIIRVVDKKVRSIFNIFNFFQIRMDAGSIPYISLDEIYDYIESVLGLNKTLTEKIKTIEKEVDRAVTIPREDMVKLFIYAQNKCNKEVFLVSDMYYSQDDIYEILRNNNIAINKKNIIVSSSLKKCKKDGDLWYYYKNCLGSKKLLHIGDNKKNDIENAREAGIDTYFVAGPREMLSFSPIGKIRNKVCSGDETVSIGMIEKELFNSPFSLSNINPKIIFRSKEQMGYVLLGNISYDYISWIAEESIKDGIDTILFFARDGFFLQRLYSEYVKQNKDKSYPRGVYFEISRRMIINSNIKSEDDVNCLFELAYDGTLSQFFMDVFGIEINEELFRKTNVRDVAENLSMIKKLIKPYLPCVLDVVEKRNIGFEKYLAGINLGKRIGVVDPWIYGTTQHYLSRYLNTKTIGYYVFCQRKNNEYSKNNIMKSCFQKEDDEWTKTPLTKYSLFFESFYTSPDGMLEYFDEDGNPIHKVKGINQMNFGVREEMFKGIIKYFDERIKLNKKLGMDEERSDFLFDELLYGLLMNNGFKVDEILKNSFFSDNSLYRNNKEYPLWE